MNGFYTVIHKPTGEYLNIRKFDGQGNVIRSPVSLMSWIARDRAQAIAQASFLGDEWAAAFVETPPTGLNEVADQERTK